MFIRLECDRIEKMWSISTIESSRDVIKANQLLQSSPANQPIVVMPFLAKIIHIGAIATLKTKYIPIPYRFVVSKFVQISGFTLTTSRSRGLRLISCACILDTL